MEGVKIVNNLQDGLGILYSDIYSADAVNTIRNSEFSQNGGSGISFKQLGMRVINSRIENNKVAGIRHNPALSAVQQRELAGWFARLSEYSTESPYDPIIIPQANTKINLDNWQTKYIITDRVKGESLHQFIEITVNKSILVDLFINTGNLDRPSTPFLFFFFATHDYSALLVMSSAYNY